MLRGALILINMALALRVSLGLRFSNSKVRETSWLEVLFHKEWALLAKLIILMNLMIPRPHVIVSDRQNFLFPIEVAASISTKMLGQQYFTAEWAVTYFAFEWEVSCLWKLRNLTSTWKCEIRSQERLNYLPQWKRGHTKPKGRPLDWNISSSLSVKQSYSWVLYFHRTLTFTLNLRSYLAKRFEAPERRER